MNKIKIAVFSLIAMLSLSGTAVYAKIEDPCSVVEDRIQLEALGCNGDGSQVMVTANNLINTALAIIGIVAVIGIILGGIQYTKSAGDVGKAAQARNTIIFSVVGLIVTLLAFALVNFVLESL